MRKANRQYDERTNLYISKVKDVNQIMIEEAQPDPGSPRLTDPLVSRNCLCVTGRSDLIII